VKTEATVKKISPLVHDPTTVHDGYELLLFLLRSSRPDSQFGIRLKSTAEKYVETYLESNSTMKDSLENLLDEMLRREKRLKQEELQDTSFSSGQKTIVEKQDDIARELLASSTGWNYSVGLECFS
jgi:hypothetical protein